MREALIILAVIAILAGLTLFKYRRQVRMMVEFWRSIRKLQQASRPHGEMPQPAKNEGKLVSCARCRTWVPEDRAIRLGKTATYCSTECLEKSASPA